MLGRKFRNDSGSSVNRHLVGLRTHVTPQSPRLEIFGVETGVQGVDLVKSVKFVCQEACSDCRKMSRCRAARDAGPASRVYAQEPSAELNHVVKLHSLAASWGNTRVGGDFVGSTGPLRHISHEFISYADL